MDKQLPIYELTIPDKDNVITSITLCNDSINPGFVIISHEESDKLKEVVNGTIQM